MPMDPRVKDLIVLINDDSDRSLTLAIMAHSVNLSASRCHYLFKANLGVSPIQYLRTIRLEKARGLLEATFLSVKQIMHVVGINDGSHFGRDFKHAYGLTPGEHRKTAKHSVSREITGPAPSVKTPQ